jgi:hypothetical protein
MTVKSRGPMDDRPSPRQQAGDLARTKKPAGRPKGEPSTIVNVRLPLTLDVHFISSPPVKQRPACMAWADKRLAQIVEAEG